MFLALKEMRHAKARYAMIISVVALVSYLVYFLTGLAWGLGNSFTQAVQNWNASSITLNQDANLNLLGSRLDLRTLKYDEKHSAPIAVSAQAIPNHKQDAPSEDKLVNTFVFGVQVGTFVEPPVSEGSGLKETDDVIADPKLQTYGYRLGDKIEIPTLDRSLTLVGFTDSNNFQAAPALFIKLDDFQADGFIMGRDPSHTVNAIVNQQAASLNPVQVENTDKAPDLQTVSISDYYQKIPGYSAQNLTFTFMIASLIGVLSLVLGIFMYVLTIQKKNIFGVLKARGVPSFYLALSGAAQSLVITTIGLTFGLGGTIASYLALGNRLPFQIAPGIFALVTVLFIAFSLLGSIFPIRVISKIDPVKALG